MGIEAYVPLKKEYHRWSDRVKLVDVPLRFNSSDS